MLRSRAIRRRSPPSRLTALLAMGSLLFGCGQTIPPTPASQSTAPASQTPSASASSVLPLGGTLRVGMYLTEHEGFQKRDDGKRNTIWDPQGTWASEPWELFRCCLLRTLMSYNGLPTSQGGAILRPDIAASDPDISNDGLTWKFLLKRGIRYAPPYAEQEVAAADFIRALERALKRDPSGAGPDDRLGEYAFFYEDVIAGARDFGLGKVASISGLEAPDPHTLVIHLLRPAGDLASRLALAAAAPIPAGAANGHDAGYGRFLVATGPYMIEGTTIDKPATGYVPGKSLTLVRNPSWQRSSDDLRGAFVDRVEVSNLEGKAADDGGLALLLTAKLDVVIGFDLSPGDITRLRADPALAARLHFEQQSHLSWVTMNIAVPPFDDIHVRRAMNYVADKTRMIQAFDPAARVQSHAIPDSMEAGLLTEYDPYATADHAGSLELAKAEIAESRYDANRDGVCDATVCRQVPTLVRAEDDRHVGVYNVLKADAAPLGLSLEPVRVDGNEFYARLQNPRKHSPIGVLDGWGSDYLNGSNWFGPLASGASIGETNASLTGASDKQLKEWGYRTLQVPGIDDKVTECLGRVGVAQAECWAEADQFLMERVVPWVPVLSTQASRITSARVAGFSFDQSTVEPALDQIALNPG